MLGGPEACSPGNYLVKNGAIWCNLGVPKYVITDLKINNFKGNKSTATKFNSDIFSPINLDVHVSIKKILRMYKGSGGYPLEAEEIQKNQTKSRLFLHFFKLFFLDFWQGSLNLQNYELAPQPY